MNSALVLIEKKMFFYLKSRKKLDPLHCTMRFYAPGKRIQSGTIKKHQIRFDNKYQKLVDFTHLTLSNDNVSFFCCYEMILITFEHNASVSLYFTIANLLFTTTARLIYADCV